MFENYLETLFGYSGSIWDDHTVLLRDNYRAKDAKGCIRIFA